MAVIPSIPVSAPNRSTQLFKWIIPGSAGSNNIKSFPASGDFYYVKELYNFASGASVADVQIKTDLTADRPYNVGTGERVPHGSAFNGIEIRNPNAGDVYIELYVGWGDFIDNRLNIVRSRPESIQPVIEAETEIVPWPGSPPATFQIPATSSVTFAPVLSGRRILQKGITIANVDPNSKLRLLDENDVPFDSIEPETTHIFPISGTVKVQNETGTAIECYVGQIYWLRPLP